jgi:lanosterol synthase
MTDFDRWRLKVENGRQTWHYLEPEEALAWPQTSCDKYWLGTLTSEPFKEPAGTPKEAAIRGFQFYKELQTEDGHWAGEYGGPMFLIPGLVISMYITQSPFPPGYETELIRYLKNRAHKSDGGWGIHIESDSNVFGTALNYVALRLLGVPADDPVCKKARLCLQNLGSVIGHHS